MYFVKTEGDSKLHDATGLDDGRRATYILPKNVTPLFFMESTAFANINLNIEPDRPLRINVPWCRMVTKVENDSVAQSQPLSHRLAGYH